MDWHNRPTHIFRSPERAVDTALNVNTSLQSLPYAKRELVAALTPRYESREEGLTQVARRIEGFYEEKFPTIWNERQADVKRLIEAGKNILRTTSFPEMNVSWRTYPDNIGHKIYRLSAKPADSCGRSAEGMQHA
jgi:hypothetical protein